MARILSCGSRHYCLGQRGSSLVSTKSKRNVSLSLSRGVELVSCSDSSGSDIDPVAKKNTPTCATHTHQHSDRVVIIMHFATAHRSPQIDAAQDDLFSGRYSGAIVAARLCTSPTENVCQLRDKAPCIFRSPFSAPSITNR